MSRAAALVVAAALAGTSACAGARLPLPGNGSDPAFTLDGADAAYVARRTAQQARLASLYAAEREALDHARGALRRLEEDAARRRAFLADLARRRRVQAETVARTAAARRRAVEAAIGAADQLLDRPQGLLFRVPTEQIFLAGTSLLRSGAADHLADLAQALRLGPSCDVRIQVLDDTDGVHSGPEQLARRRYARVHDALVAAGVPHATFLAPLPHAPYGTQVDVLVVEQPVPLAPPGR